jgi:plastocyanin
MLFSQKVFAQTVHNVTANPNFTFTPKQLTIKVGDVVKWTNAGGFHNVIADDNSFTSGPASTSAWVFEHTFNSPGTNPYYCVIHGAPGGVGMSGVITVEIATDVQDEGISIHKFDLKQNYPNPFNPSTTINFSIPQKDFVKLKIYNLAGEELKTLINEEKDAGSYQIKFDALNLPTGIYFYKLNTSNFSETKKMILLR